MKMDTKWKVCFVIVTVLYIGVHRSYSEQCSNGGTTILEAYTEPKTLQSPNYPANYPRDIYCTWSFYAFYYESDLVININDLDLEDSPDCTNASLTIYGYSRKRRREQIVRLCGNVVKNETYSIGGNAKIVFQTNSQGTGGRGFNLKYHMELSYGDDDDEYNERGLIQDWGIVLIVVFVVIGIVLIFTITLACFCQRRQRARRQPISDLVTTNITGKDEKSNYVQYLGSK